MSTPHAADAAGARPGSTYRAGRHFLFVPGPTNVPDRVLRAMHRPMEDHRSSAFPELTRSLLADLPKIVATESGQPFIFAATGTGGWEAALVNTCSPGAKLLGVRNGQFSHLFIETARKFGLDVQVIEVPWGEAVPADQVEEALRADAGHEITGVLVVHNETATGVTSDMAAVRAAIDAAGHPALLYVDGVSSIGSLPFQMDEWGVDLAICGSQKGLMLPGGLGMVFASPKAIAAGETATCPRSFFDFGWMASANATGYFPYTPALGLLFGLREALDMLFEEGLDNVFARHVRLAGGVRAAVDAWGLAQCCTQPDRASNSVTAVMTGASPAVIDIAFKTYNLSLGGGLGQMAGKLFRIGHLGDLNELMLLGAIAGAEMALADAGVAVEPGSGVAAAQGHYRGSAR
ncbi:MAG TPA: aminotransferase class V-fold PLP-dependent enzyme [Actinomycetota bacterium]|nr:aminotransferase class V-fold PLP-dependent enzyme [Actinomycetota bacterium]